MDARAADNARLVEAWEASMQQSWGPAGGLERALQYLHPEVEVIEADSLPYAGIYRGHDGFRRLAATMKELWEFKPGKTFEFVATGDRVVVLTLGRAVARATGIEVEWRLSEVCTLREGLIVEVRPFYYDTAAITAAVRGDHVTG
jgi:uncharacterized protein